MLISYFNLFTRLYIFWDNRYQAQKGIDIRDYGSGNTGFTNVLRVVGKGPAAIVLLGDALKGSMGVILGYYLGEASYSFAVLGGLFAMIGHTYPIYFAL